MLTLHLHIPKTAGTTLNKIAQRQYGPRAVIGLYDVDIPYQEQIQRLPAEVVGSARFIHGHFAYGVQSMFSQNSSIIVILRDPVDRILSLYYYARQNPHHYLHTEIVEKNLDLVDVLRLGLSTEFDNGQVRQLSGVGGTCNYGECTDRMLEQAIANLRSETTLFGLTSRFDESLLMFQQPLRWKIPYYLAQNVTRNRPKAKNIDPYWLEQIAEHNQLCLKLYEWAEREFATKVKQMGPDFISRVRWFQRSNAAYSLLRIAASSAKRHTFGSRN